jgi:chorismate synthase
MIKYDTEDARDILERASARETAARTIAGVLAKKLLGEVGVTVMSHVVSIGAVRSEPTSPGPDDIETIDASAVRCFDADTSERMIAAIDRAREERDTLGGVFEVLAYGVPIGIGSHVQHDRRLDSILAASVMSIPAIKGVEVGDGFAVAGFPGSTAHDEIVRKDGSVGRETNRAGGIEGGMSNGETIRVHGAMKPISTLMRPLRTVDMTTGESAQAVRERSDVCAVPAAAVVGEQMVAISLATEFQRKFGGDTLIEFSEAVQGYRARVERRISM